MILIAIYIPLAVIPSFFAETFFLAIGQDPEVALLTAHQVVYLLPSCFFYCNYDLRKRWMACQRITLYPMVAMIIATLLHICLCLVNFKIFNMGITGLALALSIKDFVLLATTMIYGYYSS